MPRIPRDLSAHELVGKLRLLGYGTDRQTGSHIRLSSAMSGKKHSITIPNHNPVKLGTLNGILSDIANAHGLSKTDLVNRLFYK